MMRCEECGFDYGHVPASGLADALGTLGARYRDALLRAAFDRALLSQRPDEETWSPLEYACHVRDVLLVQRERVLLALVEQRPEFAPMYRDQRVSLAQYSSEDPRLVSDEVGMTARLIAILYEALTPAQLSRKCIYNYPEPAERDLAWVGQHTLHEGQHHLRDIERSLTAI